jgi:hypothetical protein
VLLALAALAVVALAVRHVPAALRVRRIIAGLRYTYSWPDVVTLEPNEPYELASQAVRELDDLNFADLRFQRRAFMAALGENVRERIGESGGSRRHVGDQTLFIWRIGREDPALFESWRNRHGLESLAFESLMVAGRADLATLAPHEFDFVPNGSEARRSAILIHGARGAEDVGYGADFAVTVTALGEVAVDGQDDGACWLDLGEVPVEQAGLLADGDPRWTTIGLKATAEAIFRERHTYEYRTGTNVESTFAFEVVEVRRDRLRLRWRVLASRPWPWPRDR